MSKQPPPPVVRREIAVETRVLDPQSGRVEYIASDESMDSYREVIRIKGWRFSRFAKNAPFLNNHRANSIEDVLGRVVSHRIEGGKLIETVQWAIDVPANTLARIGWDMTRAGYLRAVSVGFEPVRVVSRWDSDPREFNAQATELKLDPKELRAVYLEQEQVELSAVVVGANPNAVIQMARAYKDGVLNDADLQTLSARTARVSPADSAHGEPGGTAENQAHHRHREEFMRKFEAAIRG